jgi:hypothetical protein
MLITLKTHGGFAAGVARQPRTLDTAALDEREAARVQHLVQSVMETPETAPPSRALPDAMTYTLTVQEGDRVRAIKVSDTSMTPALGELIDCLEQHARSSK